MAIASAAFGCEDIVPPVPLIHMRSLGDAEICALIYIFSGPYQSALFVIKLLQTNSCKWLWTRAVISQHVNKPLSTIIIVEKRGIKARRVGIYRIRPRSFNRWGMNNVVMGILEGAGFPLNVGIDEPKLVAVVSKAWCPYAAAIRFAAQIKLRFTR
jgi:hypothetical protein